MRATRITEHALSQAERRGFLVSAVAETVGAPDRIVTVRPGREIRQSEAVEGYVLRVVTDVSDDVLVALTAYSIRAEEADS